MDFLKFKQPQILKFSCAVFFAFTLSGCHLGYLFKSAGGELDILSRRVSIDEALQDKKISEEDKRKIRLSQEAHKFAETQMGLVSTKNYTSYVALDRPYASYVVSAAPKWELKNYTWRFPFVGEVPYKGYFNENEAKEEEKSLQDLKLDTYLRGVSAFSTLGWFRDPLLSSMLKGEDHDLVNTIIHETVHATLYIKSSADFNERLAVFIGNFGTEKFYLQREGENSATVKKIHQENEDEKTFSNFITQQVHELEAWYQAHPEKSEEEREKKFLDIQQIFKTQFLPKMQTQNYSHFADIKLNNARLLLYKTYMADLSDFQKLFDLVHGDIHLFLEKCKSLQADPKPEEGLRKLIESQKSL